MSTKTKTSTRGVVLVTVAILAIFTVLFILELIRAPRPTPVDDAALTSDTYMTEVSALLENADTARGEVAVTTQYECAACHITGAGQIAPAFAGLGERAATRRPPLTAAAYLYESLINPGAYLVEKEEGTTYPNSMPANYHERMTEQELGDVIAYLLTQ
jgi:mono/diheme cytochrome c family protein